MSAIVNIEYLQKTPKKSFSIHLRYESLVLIERTARREAFLADLECVVPWRRLEAPIEPHYPLARKGREPYRLSTVSPGWTHEPDRVRAKGEAGARWFGPFKRMKVCDTAPEQKRLNRLMATLRPAAGHPFRFIGVLTPLGRHRQ